MISPKEWQMMRNTSDALIQTAALLLVLISCTTTAWADKLVLKDGRTLEGRILQSDDPVRLKMIDGIEVLIPRRRIASQQQGPTLLDQFESRRAAVPESDVGQLFQLAKWCEEQGVWQGRNLVLQQVLAVDPEHRQARRRLGFQRFEGQWYQTDQLRELTRQPLTDQQRAAAEQRLSSWAADALERPALHILSAPAGLCVRVAPRKELGSSVFQVGDTEYVRQRTPCSLQLEPGKYVVSIERVTPQKTEYYPESAGRYQLRCEGGMVHGLVFEVEVVAGRSAYVFGLFRPKSPADQANYGQQLAPVPLFDVSAQQFATWARDVDLPRGRQSDLLDCLRRAGKAMFAKEDRVHMVEFAGPDALRTRTLVLR
jgi:hypothetical protein